MSKKKNIKKNMQKRKTLENKKKAMIKSETKIKKLAKAKAIKIGLLMALGLASVSLFPSCVKTVDCPEQAPHAHLYVDEQTGLSRYVVSEREYVRSKGQKLVRTEQKVHISEDEKEIMEYMNKNGLFAIGENKEELNNIMQADDYLEYEFGYYHEEMQPTMMYVYNSGTKSYDLVPGAVSVTVHDYAWTADKDITMYNGSKIDLTGNKRLVHNVYNGYKLVRDKNDRLRMEKGDTYDSLAEIPADNFIKIDDYTSEIRISDLQAIMDFERLQEEALELQTLGK